MPSLLPQAPLNQFLPRRSILWTLYTHFWVFIPIRGSFSLYLSLGLAYNLHLLLGCATTCNYKLLLLTIFLVVLGNFCSWLISRPCIQKNCSRPSLGPGTWKICSYQVLGHVTWKNLFWSSPELGTWKIFPFPSPKPCHLEKILFCSSPELGTWKICLFPSPRPCHLETIFCFAQVLGQVHGKFSFSQVLGHATQKISVLIKFWASYMENFPFPKSQVMPIGFFHDH